MRREPFRVTCDDGWPLEGELVIPAAPRAAVVLGHAMMVDRRTVERVAARLAERGCAVVVADLRGHGRSGPRADQGGTWSYDDLVERDTPALLGLAREKFPELAVTAVGHSLFGHVALAYAARHPAAAPERLVLIAANVWAPRWEPELRLRLAKRARFAAMWAATRAVGRFPTRRLRMGTADEAEPYVRQMVGFYREDAWLARDGFDWGGALGAVPAPILSIAGAGDALMCRAASARAFVAAAPRARTVVAGRASGLELDPGHMALVLDERCRPVWDAAAGFALDGAGSADARQVGGG